MKQSFAAVVFALSPLLLATPALAWTGPGSSPPSGNVPTPLNVSSTAQTKSGELLVGSSLPASSVGLDVTGIAAVDSLVVGGNTTLGASTYINFGSTVGTNGYGIWDNGGTLNFKNSGGSWQSLQQFICTLTACSGTGVTGSGSSSYVPRWTGASSLGNSSISSDGVSATSNGNFYASGNIMTTGGGLIGTYLNDTTGPYGQLLLVGGNYGAFFRNDGANTYFLLTNSGNQYGIWNALRPLVVNDSTGYVSMYSGVGVSSGLTADTLAVTGNTVTGNSGNPLKFTSAWSNFPATAANDAEISNDTGSYKTLMIVGNRSNNAAVRSVSVWDQLNVNGSLVVTASVTSPQYCIGGSCITSWPSVGLSGSGSSNYVPRWTGASSLGNSSISSDGTSATANGNFFVTSNLYLSAANPTIQSGSSYIVIPNGLYVSGGTPYFQTQAQMRGGIHNDSAGYLEVDGGTSGITYFPGSVGIQTASPVSALQVKGTGTFGTDANGTVSAWSTGGEGGTINLRGSNGTNMFLEDINGTFRLINSGWTAQIFSVDQSGNTTAGGSITAPQYCIGSSCITSWPSAYNNTDTLDTVTGRGNTTGNPITVGSATVAGWDNQFYTKDTGTTGSAPRHAIGGAHGWDPNMLYVNGWNDYTSGVQVGGNGYVSSLSVTGNLFSTGNIRVNSQWTGSGTLNMNSNQVWNDSGNLYLNWSAPSGNSVVVGGQGGYSQSLSVPNGSLCLNGSCITSWSAAYNNIDTLDTVTSRGYATANNIQVNGVTVTGDWFRVNNSTGIYWNTWGGGWYMSDASWMRSYNNISVYTGGQMRADGGFCIGGSCISSWPSAGVGGSGTAGYIPLFTGAAALGNSIITANGSSVTVGGNLNANNLTLTPANPTITSGGSYVTIPNGLYVSGGTPYFQTQAQMRGGIHNDSAGYLEVDGGTSGITYFPGNVGIGTAAPGQKLSVAGTIESTSGGIKFPDGTVQTTAASASSPVLSYCTGSQSCTPSCPTGLHITANKIAIWQTSTFVVIGLCD